MEKKTGGQKHPRFTDQELELIKETFAENEELIRVCYKVFFQLPLTELEERVKNDTFKGEDLRKIFDKLFCPGVENEQIFFGVDDWLDVQLDKPVSEAWLYIQARDTSVRYTKNRVDELFGKEPGEGLSFKTMNEIFKDSPEISFINLLARKEIVAKVRNMFGTLQMWAGTRKETKEEMMKRLFTDSNK